MGLFQDPGVSTLLPRYLALGRLIEGARVLELGAAQRTDGESARFLSKLGARSVCALDVGLQAAVSTEPAFLPLGPAGSLPSTLPGAPFDLVLAPATPWLLEQLDGVEAVMARGGHLVTWAEGDARGSTAQLLKEFGAEAEAEAEAEDGLRYEDLIGPLNERFEIVEVIVETPLLGVTLTPFGEEEPLLCFDDELLGEEQASAYLIVAGDHAAGLEEQHLVQLPPEAFAEALVQRGGEEAGEGTAAVRAAKQSVEEAWCWRAKAASARARALDADAARETCSIELGLAREALLEQHTQLSNSKEEARRFEDIQIQLADARAELRDLQQAERRGADRLEERESWIAGLRTELANTQALLAQEAEASAASRSELVKRERLVDQTREAFEDAQAQAQARVRERDQALEEAHRDRERHQALVEELSRVQGHQVRSEAEAKSLRVQARMQEDALQASQAQLATHQEMLEAQRSQFAALEETGMAQAATEREAQASLRGELEAVREALRSSQEGASALEQKFAQSARDHQAFEKALEQTKAQGAEEREALQGKAEALSLLLEAERAKSEALKQQQEELEEQGLEHQAVIAEGVLKVQVLEGLLAALRDEHAALASASEGASHQVAALEAELEGAASQLEGLQGSLAQSELEAQELEGEASLLQQRSTEFEAQLELLEAEAKQQAQALREAEGARDQAKGRVEELETELGVVQTQALKAKDTIQSLEEDQQFQRARTASLEETLGEQGQALDALGETERGREARIQVLEEELESSQRELGERAEALETLHRECAEEGTRAEVLAVELQEAKVAISEAASATASGEARHERDTLELAQLREQLEAGGVALEREQTENKELRAVVQAERALTREATLERDQLLAGQEALLASSGEALESSENALAAERTLSRDLRDQLEAGDKAREVSEGDRKAELEANEQLLRAQEQELTQLRNVQGSAESAQKDRDDLEASLGALEARAALQIEESRLAREELGALQQERDSLLGRLERAGVELAQAEQQQAELGVQLESAVASNDTDEETKAELAQLKAQLAAHSDDQSRLEQRLKAVTLEGEAKDQSLVLLSAEQQRLESAVAVGQTDLAATRSDLERRDQEAERASQRITELEAALAELKAKATADLEHSAEATELRETLTTEELEGLRRSAVQLETAEAKLKEFEPLRASVQELKSRWRETQAALQEAQSALAAHEGPAPDAETPGQASRAAQTEQELSGLREEASHLREQLQASGAKVERLQGQLALALTEAEATQTAREEPQSLGGGGAERAESPRRLEHALQQREGQVRQLKSEQDVLAAQISKLKAALLSKDEELRGVQLKLEGLATTLRAQELASRGAGEGNPARGPRADAGAPGQPDQPDQNDATQALNKKLGLLERQLSDKTERIARLLEELEEARKKGGLGRFFGG